MPDPTIITYSSRGTVFYTPSNNIVAGKLQPPRLPAPPCRPRLRRPLFIHITRLPAGFVPFDLRPVVPPREPTKPSRFQIKLGKLASRETAKRVFGSVFAPFSSNSSSASTPVSDSTRASSPRRRGRPLSTTALPTPPRPLSTSLSAASADPNTIFARRAVAAAAVPSSPMSLPANSSQRLSRPRAQVFRPTGMAPELEKPVCSGNGVSCFIHLAEPAIFLTGLDHDGTSRNSGSSSSAILRGKLRLVVTKSAKIKSVTVKFTGRGRTEWPEGLPPAKTEFYEEESFRTQVLPFFNALYEGSESGYGAMCNYTLKGSPSASSSVTNLADIGSDTSSAHGSVFSLPMLNNRSNKLSVISTKEQKRLSLQSYKSRSFQKSESPVGPTPQQKGYKIFHPGTYEYSFEIPIDNSSPETTKLPLASVTWMLEVLVERAGTFKANLQGLKEIPVIRSPSEDSLELVEPISISRTWEDQLHYEIIISGKSFPLGSKIPIAFKLTPLAKVQVHKLKVYVSEGIEYHSNSRQVARKDITRKLLLMEKSAGKPLAKDYLSSEIRVLRGGEPDPETREQNRNKAIQRRALEARVRGRNPEPIPDSSENILGDIDLGLDELLGQTEIEMNVQLPTCEIMEKDRARRMAHDCTWKNVDVHHWIKIVMRLSRLDADDPAGKKRRHFEISIDSPITILSCRATQANLALPEYSGPDLAAVGEQHVCGCPNAALLNSSPASSSGSIPTLHSINGEALPELPRPPQAHLSTNSAVQRPIHMLRNPSYNPPAFDADQPPPPIATPPPLYDNVIGTPSHDGLADYFARLAEHEDDQTDDDDEDAIRASNRGRVYVANPRTPGGRIARSMDLDRAFMFNASNSGVNSLNQELGNETSISG